MKQKIIGYAVALIFILIGGMVMQMMIAGKKEPEKKEITPTIKKVQVIEANPSENPITIPINGKLESFNKIELYAEVSGTVLPSVKNFKEGVSFSTGETLIRIDDRDTKASLVAQRSAFQTLLNQTLTDIKLDYSTNFSAWNTYLQNFNPETRIKELPVPKTDKEKRFLIAKNIYNNFYNIKSQEVKLSKYTLKAPFSGVLSTVAIQKGSVIRPGQKLGEYIQPNIFELEAPINIKDIPFLSSGDKVQLFSNDISGAWEGTIKRIGKNVDAKTQSIMIYIAVKATTLKEGMYLRGIIKAQNVAQSIVIPRKLLNEDGSIFLVEKDKLKKMYPKVEKIGESSIILTGVDQGDKVLQENFIGAHEGLKVKISK